MMVFLKSAFWAAIVLIATAHVAPGAAALPAEFAP